MNLSNISFPYPVLGSFDDILPAPDEPKVDIRQDKNYYHFIIKLAYDNVDIMELVDNDFADYVCEVNCERTRYNRCYKGKLLTFQIDIPRRSVAGKIIFSCTITVKRPIANYVNSGFHSDYYGHTFNMEPGDILGMFSQFYYVADIEYDKLKAVGAFMEIKETTEDLPSTNLENDKIELRLPTELFNQYKNNPAVSSCADILHASLVQNSLIFALCRFSQYDGRTKWAEAIKFRIDTEKELEEFRDTGPEEWQVDTLSYILLGNPYGRMFNYLSNLQDVE